MEAFFDTVFGNRMLYVGYLFAFLAAIAFLVFLRGFLSGLPKVFTIDWHEDHQEHHRTRVTWGFLMLLHLFILWQIIRWLAGLFSNTF